jgi:hypothetical protein
MAARDSGAGCAGISGGVASVCTSACAAGRCGVAGSNRGMQYYVHPETGEILATEEEWRAALTAVEEQLAPLYRLRRDLREAHADRFEAAAMPTHRRNRSETQEKVARCPRCGQSYQLHVLPLKEEP